MGIFQNKAEKVENKHLKENKQGEKKWKKKENNGGQLATKVLNLLLYLLYIVVVCIITFGASSVGTHGLTKVIHYHFIDAPFKGYGDQITTFRTSYTINDFWAFSEEIMIPNFYQTDREEHTPLFHDQIESKTGIEYDNHLAGGARFRQIRVKQGACEISELVPGINKKCFPQYSQKFEDSKNIPVGAAFEGGVYKEASELHGTRHWGSVNTYSGAGYSVVLDNNKTVIEDVLTNLKKVLWITRATRVVFLEFILYNPNINVFSYVRLAWEIPATGGVKTSWDIKTLKLNQYRTVLEIFVFVCEMAFICFTVFYIIQEIVSCCQKGCKKYFCSGWTYISIIIFVISIICIIYSLVRFFTLTKIVTLLATKSKIFLDLDHLIQWENFYKNVDAVLIFLVWIKLFKYLTFSRGLLLLRETISRCARDIGGFGLIFLIVLLAFSQLGYILFGVQVFEFSTFGLSIITMWRFTLSDFNYEEVYNAHRFLGPIFFLLYMVFVFLILLSMFLAIINDSYHLCQEGIDNKRKHKSTKNSTFFSCCNKRKASTFQDIQQVHIEPCEIRQYLRKKNFSEMDIEIFLDRFHVAANDALDGNEAHALLSDIMLNNYIGKKDSSQNTKFTTQTKKHPTTVSNTEKTKEVQKAEIDIMTDRLGVIESTVVDLVPKIETMLKRIELNIEKQNNANSSIMEMMPKRPSLNNRFFRF